MVNESVVLLAYLVILIYAVFAITQIWRILREWYADHKRKEAFYVERNRPERNQ